MLGCVTDLTSYDFVVFSNHHVSFGCRFSSFIVTKKTAAFVLELEIKSKGFKKAVDGQCQTPAKVVNI